MKAFFVGGAGVAFIIVAVYAALFHIVFGSEEALMPWFVALLVFVIGLFLVRQGRRLERWTKASREGTETS